MSVLGPVAVDGDTDGLARRERVVLATLALSPGEVVTPDTLADALWGDQPPATWTKVVQGSVMRIRKALGADAVRTVPRGYVLDLPDDAIDGVRFEQLVRRGRELLALHEPDRARFALTQALDLWTGPALPDLGGWAPGEEVAARWEELRRDAEELRVEAALATGGWREVLVEAGRLVQGQPFRENRWALLARAQYLAGRQGDALATLHRARAVLAGELGLDPGPELASLEQAILHQDPALVPDADGTSPVRACPYRGLLPYGLDDAEHYFGRDADIARCLELLVHEHVVAIVGPSGGGKSSLARAGVAAALRAQDRVVSVLTPGPHPLEALDQVGGVRRRGVLVVDQLEEVGTLGHDDADRDTFLSALADHVDDGGELVITLRADRIGTVAAHPAMARLLERGLHLLGAMSEDDLRSAIEGPARQAGLLLEPGLVDLLVREVAGEPGALPLMSHALAQTWSRREGRTLTVDGYHASGGIQEAVANSAERVFLDLTEPDRRSMQSLLLRMVAREPTGEPTRSPLPRRLVASDATHERITELLVGVRLLTSDGETVGLAHESLARAWPRLRRWLDEDAEGQLILRHLSAAADAWDTMGRPDSELYRGARLAKALEWRHATAADLHPTERAFLVDSEELARQEQLSAEERLEAQARSNRSLRRLVVGLVSVLVIALVATGFALRESSRADRQANLASVRELASASRAVRAEDPELAVLLALEATSPDLHDGDAAPREAIEALHEAIAANRLVMRVADAGGRVSWSPDGRLVATEGPEGSGLVELLDAETGSTVASFRGHDIDVNDVAFGPDGRLATAGDDGTLRVWDTEREEELASLSGEGQVWNPTFSTRGRPLVAGVWRDGGLVKVAELDGDPNPPVVSVFSGPSGYVNEAQLSPDGQTMVIVSDTAPTAALVETATGEVVHRLSSQGNPALTAAISPDGRWVAVGFVDGVVRIHDVATGRRVVMTDNAPSEVVALAWSSNSRRLATSEVKGDVRVYEVAEDGARQTAFLSGASSDGGIVSLAFSPEGDRLVGGDLGVTAARVWDISDLGAAEVTNVRGAKDSFGVAFGSDGRLFTVAGPGVVAGYDLERSAQEVPVELTWPPPSASAPPAEAHGLVASQHSSAVAVGGSPWGVAAWDADSGELLFSAPKFPDGRRGFRWRPDISADGQLFAVASPLRIDLIDRAGEIQHQLSSKGDLGFRQPVFSPADDLVAVVQGPLGRDRPEDWSLIWWDWQSDEVRTSPAVPSRVLDFSPDGTKLALAAFGSQSQVLSVATGEVLFTLDGQDAGVSDITFSPDGSLIASGGYDGRTVLWDADDGSPVLELPAGDEEVSSLAFSPDGRYLATDSFLTSVVRVWAMDLDELREIGRERVARDLTSSECRRYLYRACD